MRRDPLRRPTLACAFPAIAIMIAFAGCEAPRLSHTTGASTPGLPATARASASPMTTAPGGAPRIEMPPGSVPTLDEEVWVIVRPEATASVPDDEIPGSGALVGRPSNDARAEPIPLPLVHTEVDASVGGYLATVGVTQRFENHTDLVLEAIYVFPLPHDAAVHGFVMRIGERRIRGIVRERAEAEAMYREAKRQGYVASLLTQERPNVFTQSVANLAPGARIDVEISYVHAIDYRDGWYEMAIPTVVGPRFNPPGWSEGVGAIAHGGAASGQPVDVPYLRPGERSGHDIGISVSIDAGVRIESIESPSHAITTVERSSTQALVTLRDEAVVPNADFVLRYKVASDAIRPALLAHRDERGGFFTLLLLPPEGEPPPRAPVEMVFVLDCSGSMRGEPLTQAKRSVVRALERLGSDDAFQVIRFSDSASTLGDRILPASRENVRRGIRYVKDLEAGGGTMMLTGLRASLDLVSSGDWSRYVVFLTDGFIGNEREVLSAIDGGVGTARIFSFGIGSAPNRYLVEQMARHGHGAVAYVGANVDAARIMDTFLDGAQHPAMTEIELAVPESSGGELLDVHPRRVPDLFAGRPVVVSGRFRGPDAPRLRVRGTVAGRLETFVLEPQEIVQPALPVIWARARIGDLIHRNLDPANADEVAHGVRSLALEYQLMSPYTAFIAVDSLTRTAGDAVTVPVGVPVPEGVPYETTVGQ